MAKTQHVAYSSRSANEEDPRATLRDRNGQPPETAEEHLNRLLNKHQNDPVIDLIHQRGKAVTDIRVRYGFIRNCESLKAPLAAACAKASRISKKT